MFTEFLRHVLRSVELTFGDSALRALGLIGCVLAIFVLARWLAGLGTAGWREDPRICPGCYNRARRHAGRCSYCGTELDPRPGGEAPLLGEDLEHEDRAREERVLEDAQRDEWQREERARRRKVFLYPVLLGWCAGMLLAALLFLLLGYSFW